MCGTASCWPNAPQPPLTNNLDQHTSVEYKANGPTFAQGFLLYDLPSQLEQRAQASNLSNTHVFNQYISGVGYINMSST
jgi:hypothetical protein